jgi:formate-dependent nitrite reductase membrane component NrfD
MGIFVLLIGIGIVLAVLYIERKQRKANPLLYRSPGYFRAIMVIGVFVAVIGLVFFVAELGTTTSKSHTGGTSDIGITTTSRLAAVI